MAKAKVKSALSIHCFESTEQRKILKSVYGESQSKISGQNNANYSSLCWEWQYIRELAEIELRT